MIGRSLVAALAFLLTSALQTPAPVMAAEVKTERVSFKHGTSGANIEDKIQGRDTRQYIVGARSGQHMRVTLTSPSDSIYFNVFAPGKIPGSDEAMFIGATGGDTYDGVLPASGDYMIQVYLYRNAARAGERAKFLLDIAVDAKADSGTDAVVPGTSFNATGKLGCARDIGQPLGQCKFGVVRNADGTAVLTIFWPDAGSRVIYFEKGIPTRYDKSQADGDARLTYSKDVDLFTVVIGTQRFEFPEAAIAGG